MTSALSPSLFHCWRRRQCCEKITPPTSARLSLPIENPRGKAVGNACPRALGCGWLCAREAAEKRQRGEAWQYHLVGAASHRQPLPGKKGEKRTESREIKHSLSLFLTGIILYYSAICLVTATASAVQKSYKQPYGTSEWKPLCFYE